MSWLQPTMVTLLLLGGLGVALLGSVKLALARRLRIDEARVGGLVSLFGFTMAPVIFAAGFLTDLVDWQAVVIGGSVLFAASLLVLGCAKSYGTALVAVVLFSAAWALLINIGNVLTPLTFAGETEAYAFNLANVFFGLGAFLTPLAVTFLLRLATLSVSFFLLAALALVPAFLALGVDFASYRVPSSEVVSEQGLGFLLVHPLLWLCGFALFFYGPLEASLGAWATSYLGEQGVKEGTAAGLLSGFWLMYMAGRLTTAFTLPAHGERLLILVLSIACIGLLASLVFCRNRSLAMGLILLAGLIFGPIFPTIMAVLLGPLPKHLHGRAVGLFFAIGGIGWTVIPILIGAYAKRTSIRHGFRIATGAAVGLSIVAMLLFMKMRELPESP